MVDREVQLGLRLARDVPERDAVQVHPVQADGSLLADQRELGHVVVGVDVDRRVERAHGAVLELQRERHGIGDLHPALASVAAVPRLHRAEEMVEHVDEVAGLREEDAAVQRPRSVPRDRVVVRGPPPVDVERELVDPSERAPVDQLLQVRDDRIVPVLVDRHQPLPARLDAFVDLQRLAVGERQRLLAEDRRHVGILGQRDDVARMVSGRRQHAREIDAASVDVEQVGGPVAPEPLGERLRLFGVGVADERNAQAIRIRGDGIYVAGRNAPASNQRNIDHFPAPSANLAKPMTTGIVRIDNNVETATSADGKRPSPPWRTENIVTLAPTGAAAGMTAASATVRSTPRKSSASTARSVSGTAT